MQIATPPPRKHTPITSPPCSLHLQFRHIPNILKLGFGLNSIFSFFTAKAAKHVARFFFAADFDEPPGRFGEPPDDGEEEEQGKNLKGDGEAPTDGGGACVDVGESAGDLLAGTFFCQGGRELTIQASRQLPHQRCST
jgi:hypothetical protein